MFVASLPVREQIRNRIIILYNYRYRYNYTGSIIIYKNDFEIYTRFPAIRSVFAGESGATLLSYFHCTLPSLHATNLFRFVCGLSDDDEAPLFATKTLR